jgi:predicted kinase
MLGKYWVPKREPLVTEIEIQSVIAGLNAGYTVLLDATNLNPKALREWEYMAEEYEFEIEHKEFKISLRKALWRDWLRGFKGGRRVGAKVVRSFYERYYVEPNK